MLTARYPSAVRIERGFIRLHHGDVHYRAAGSGPVVLALHESPRSSLSMLPLIDALSVGHRVIAPDTPGYGLSQALSGDEPSLDDFLDVIEQLLDRLGIRRVALYGAHTGAALATAFALRAPDRVTALVLDGLSAFTDDEVISFRRDYLPAYEPHWDGRHVMGLWSRCRDLFTWFPWHDRTSRTRLASDPADLGPIHRSAMGFIQAGAEYAKAYIRAASFRPNAVMADLQPPTRVIARPDDLIADHLNRLTPGSQWEIVALGNQCDAWCEAILGGLKRGDPPDEAAPIPVSSEGSSFIKIGGGWLHAIVQGPRDGDLRLLIPDLPGDPHDLIAAQAQAYPDARLIVISPPGCGWSDPFALCAWDLTSVIDVLEVAASRLSGRLPLSVVGEGAAALLADLLAERLGSDVTAEHVSPPGWLIGTAPLPDAPLLRPIPPAWDGSHLASAWFQLRDLQLYDLPPATSRIAHRRGEDRPDIAQLDRRFRAYVQGPEAASILDKIVEHRRALPGVN